GAELGFGVNRPKLFSRRKVEAIQVTFRAESVDLIARNGRDSARAFIETEIILVSRRIAVRPERLARSGIEAFDSFLVADPVEENKFPAGYGWSAEPLANFPLPDDRRHFLWP